MRHSLSIANWHISSSSYLSFFDYVSYAVGEQGAAADRQARPQNLGADPTGVGSEARRASEAEFEQYAQVCAPSPASFRSARAYNDNIDARMRRAHA
jgi:uncharacterized MAPEG superfamily protein